VGDFDSIRKEVQEFFKKISIKEIRKTDQNTSDLNKCLYVSLERISEMCDTSYSKKPCAILILGAGGRIDHTLATFHNVHQYNNNYSLLANTEIYMISTSSMSVFLRSGINHVFPSKKWESREEGYSLIPLLQDKLSVKISEFEKEEELYTTTRDLKFGSSLFFRKKSLGDNIKIEVNGELQGILIYSTTTTFHRK